MAKGRLPDGYRGVDLIIKEFRIKNPKGKVETSHAMLGDGYVIITAKITTDDGAIGSGMSSADITEDKAIEKAESGAIRRALLTLGYESIAFEDSDMDKKQEEPKEEKRSFKREEPKQEAPEKSQSEEKPKSRFGNKASEAKPKAEDDAEESEDQEEGKPKFQRGSRFQRN